jgi:type IV secretion system protein VirD4
MSRRPDAAPSKSPRPLWLRALIWIAIGYAALNVFALVTLLEQNGAFRGMFGILALLGGGWVVYRLFRASPADKQASLSDNYGTARFEGMQITPPHEDWLREGIFLGKSSNPDANSIPLDRQPGIPICTTPEHHTLIVARTRTGKGTRVIIPTLLRYSGSMVVIDPKGENAAVTARPRLFAKAADKIHVINPWGGRSDPQ